MEILLLLLLLYYTRRVKIKKILLVLFTLTTLSFSESISEIQGITLTSTFVNKEVSNVDGIVTIIRKNKFNNGFFMQSEKSDNDLRTSYGIYIENKSKMDVKVGDLVSVNGIVEKIQFEKVE